MLTDRQREILCLVVARHLEDGRPVGSRAVAGAEGVEWSPSTIRAELAALERAGYLTHPHTSAGRVPTDSGYRLYVDDLLAAGPARPARGAEPAADLSVVRREVEDAMREATSTLSRITDLLAVVTAPPLDAATIHRVEVLLLQPNTAMVVVITSAGGVNKRIFSFQRPLDPGLVEWASSYLNERLTGIGVGARLLAGRLADPELGPAERGFIEEIAVAFSGLAEATEDSLYVDGAARLLSAQRRGDLSRVDELMRTLERRAGVLSMMRSALEKRSVFLWIGAENPRPELREVSVVGANYGLGHRNLGSVGVVGPLRMDYAKAIGSVRETASELSRYFESVYE